MPLNDLFEADDVRQFAVKNFDRAAFKSDHWTFLHIPKTAGSSLREEIANVLQPDYNIEVNYTGIDQGDVDADFSKKLDQAIDTYTRNGYFENTKFVSGHFMYRDIARYEAFNKSKLITMLRNPLARLRSDYQFRTSPEHPLWESEIRRYPTFSAFVENPQNQNTMFSYLCRDENEVGP